MSDWVLACELSELARRKRKQVTVAGEPVALFLVGDDVFALHDTCIHQQRSLSKGVLLRGRVICPGHQWAFDPATGYVEEQDRCQPSHDVRVEDGKVYVDPRQQLRVAGVPGPAVDAGLR